MPLTGKWVCRQLSFFPTQVSEWCCHVAGSNSISNFGIKNSTRIAAAGVNSIHNKKMTPSGFGKGWRKHAPHVCTQMSGMGCCWISPMAKEGAIGKMGDNQDGFTHFPLASFLGGSSQEILKYIENTLFRIILRYDWNDASSKRRSGNHSFRGCRFQFTTSKARQLQALLGYILARGGQRARCPLFFGKGLYRCWSAGDVQKISKEK